MLDRDKIWLFIAKKIAQKSAKYNDKNLGIITLHECASIYASGVFGEIFELYVEPEYRSLKVGDMLRLKPMNH